MTSPVEEDEIQLDGTDDSDESGPDSFPYEITYYPADYTLKGYVDKHEAGQLVIPKFQRNYVWDQVRASKLIESFLLGLPVPGVFLYRDKATNKLEVIDGQQRIQTVIQFFAEQFNERPFRLKSVQPHWNGRKFSELDEVDRFQLQDAVLRATVIQQLDSQNRSSIYHIFERLNTGGVKLSPMEIRKCVHHGKFFELLVSLNANAEWREIVGFERIDKRLRDLEFVLRIIALSEKWQEYEKPMKGFLNHFMEFVNGLPSSENQVLLRRLEVEFNHCCATVLEALGPKPFHLKTRLNLAALDSVMAVMMKQADVQPAQLKARFHALLEIPDFSEAVTMSTSDKAVLRRRFELATATLLGE